jgi:hypothetical protein
MYEADVNVHIAILDESNARQSFGLEGPHLPENDSFVGTQT